LLQFKQSYLLYRIKIPEKRARPNKRTIETIIIIIIIIIIN
jgi:hypothetical protein